MNNRGRNIFLVVLFIAILAGILFFGRFLRPSDLNGEQPPIRTVVRLTQTTEAPPDQTVTASATIMISATARPEDATLNAQRQHGQELIEATGDSTETTPVVTQEDTAQPTPTATATPTPNAAQLTAKKRTATPTLCPASDVVCPGGNATLNPQQRVFQLMASAEGTEYAQLAMTVRALATTPTPTERVTAVSITTTPTSSYQQTSCAFSWVHQAVPEAATALQNAFKDAGVKSIGVIQVDAFGENCLDANGKIVSFGAMSSDFYLTATVNNLNDTDELAQIITTAYKTIKALKVNLPGGPGYIDIMITANGSTKHYRAQFSDLRSAIEAGKDGETLLEMGGLR